MKKIYTLCSLLFAAITLTFTACNSLEPDNVSTSSYTFQVKTDEQQELYTAESLFPEGDVIPFLILPRDGWTAGPGEEVHFRAFLLDPETGVYNDVTFSDKTKWSSSFGGGGMVFNGANPDLSKVPGSSTEITFYATYNKQISAETIGHYVVPAEYEFSGNEER